MPGMYHPNPHVYIYIYLLTRFVDWNRSKTKSLLDRNQCPAAIKVVAIFNGQPCDHFASREITTCSIMAPKLNSAHLVGGIPTPLKRMSSSLGSIIPICSQLI